MRLSLSRIVLDGHGGGCPSQSALMAAHRQRAVYGAPLMVTVYEPPLVLAGRRYQSAEGRKSGSENPGFAPVIHRQVRLCDLWVIFVPRCPWITGTNPWRMFLRQGSSIRQDGSRVLFRIAEPERSEHV